MSEFNWSVRVYYEDTDAGGVVYHANYLKFFERARTEMLRSFGFEQDSLRDQHGLIFVVRSVNIDYLKSAYFNNLLVVGSKILECKKTNFTFEQTIMCDQVLLSVAQIRIACLDVLSMKPKPIPSAILEKLN